VDRLTRDARIVRNRRKIEATVHNAQTMLDLEREHGTFKKYLRAHGSFESAVADMRKRFKFLGDTGAYYFLYCVGEPVPDHEEWMARRPTPVGPSSRGGRARRTPAR
jgi:DNA-3-methyladenine glycosylase I